MSYRGNRCSAPHLYAGKSVVVREPLDSSLVRIFHQLELIAEHRLGTGKGRLLRHIINSTAARHFQLRAGHPRVRKQTGRHGNERRSDCKVSGKFTTVHSRKLLTEGSLVTGGGPQSKSISTWV